MVVVVVVVVVVVLVAVVVVTEDVPQWHMAHYMAHGTLLKTQNMDHMCDMFMLTQVQ